MVGVEEERRFNFGHAATIWAKMAAVATKNRRNRHFEKKQFRLKLKYAWHNKQYYRFCTQRKEFAKTFNYIFIDHSSSLNQKVSYKTLRTIFLNVFVF